MNIKSPLKWCGLKYTQVVEFYKTNTDKIPIKTISFRVHSQKDFVIMQNDLHDVWKTAAKYKKIKYTTKFT